MPRGQCEQPFAALPKQTVASQRVQPPFYIIFRGAGEIQCVSNIIDTERFTGLVEGSENSIGQAVIGTIR